MDSPTDDRTADELRRLRALVGDDEASYEQLRADLRGAEQDAREREGELGRLRDRVAELERRAELLARRNRVRFQVSHNVRRSLRVARRFVTTGRLRAPRP